MRKARPSSIRVEGNDAFVSLTQGLEAVIDAADVPLLSGYAWTAQVGAEGHAYARRYFRGGALLMHRVLMRAEKGLCVDHIDGDGLNNRRSNLRIANQSQNNMNMLVTRRNKIGVKGVSVGKTGKFEAKIKYQDKNYYLGGFPTPEEASAAYYGAARVLFGDFAKK
ncbi:HNH endonuclease [Methylobacterium sp. B4]|uniref:HNH endonuclease n=1 Tax=Methylobacterium sp. B4 TaxID=1938755 RepID=UPI000D8CD7AB|nr:HNH endonuclease [Methylobacterium sp. B4]PXW51311.1 HNH endonuclease [Methylobacterium sp. B4]